MHLPSDFKELLELFNARKVEYLIVGGYALAFHGAPRYTGDIDLFVKPTSKPSAGSRLVACPTKCFFYAACLWMADRVRCLSMSNSDGRRASSTAALPSA